MIDTGSILSDADLTAAYRPTYPEGYMSPVITEGLRRVAHLAIRTYLASQDNKTALQGATDQICASVDRLAAIIESRPVIIPFGGSPR